MFSIGNGRLVNLWSGGDILESRVGAIYGAAVATSAEALDYVGGVSGVPETCTLASLAGGLVLIGAFAVRRRRGR